MIDLGCQIGIQVTAMKPSRYQDGDLGFRDLGFRVLGFRGLGFRVC